MSNDEAKLQSYINGIEGLREEAVIAARARQASLAKPPQSLGQLENIAVRIAGVNGRLDCAAKRRRLVVFAADNGVVDEGVASAPRSVTLMQTINLTRGMTGAATLCRYYNAELLVYDVGVCAPVPCDAVINRKIAYGTKNIAKEPAMTREQAVTAMLYGFDAAREAKEANIEILGVGEMGIGNTTTSAAVLSALLAVPAEETTGRGGGVTDEAFLRKKRVIDAAIALNMPDRSDVLDVIAKVGGFDIAAMTGAYIGAAYYRIPVVIDGFIAVVAALCAKRLCELSSEFMIPSHKSRERGYMIAMDELGLSPMLLMDMRLGEGSGCPMMFEIADSALFVLNNMATFDEASIDDGYLSEIRKQTF